MSNFSQVRLPQGAQRAGRWLRQAKWRLLGPGVALLLAGCTQMGYYAQAVQGQLSLLAGARPIEQWLNDPAVEQSLKQRLLRAQEIRDFAARELGLPDNGSYKHYADLQRPYVLWNVVAAPALSLKPVQWCFPVAGCVNYRGYYSQADARAFAQGLRQQGYDVQISGVPAYSTLGWFNDPVLSTFIHYSEAELARLVFHELAHQVAYAQNDSRFNESFAVAVEEEGVRRWLAQRGDADMRARYADYAQRRQDFLGLLLSHRTRLEAVYAGVGSGADKQRQKAAIFASLEDGYQALKQRWGGYAGYDRWFAEPLSNAHLAAIATYHDFVPAFRGLLQQSRGLPAFYEAARQLSTMQPSERHSQLVRYEQAAPVAARQPAPPGATRVR